MKQSSGQAGGESHIRKFTLFYLIRGPHDGEAEKKNKNKTRISEASYLLTAPDVALRVRGDHKLAPYSGPELGTRD